MTQMPEDAVELLLVEDNPADVELTIHALTSNNITNSVRVIRDGAEALDYIFCKGPYAGRNISDRPNVILLDLKLPLVDGLEVLRQIKQSPETQSIPVVVLTSSREERDIVESYKLGVNSYIVKPVDFEQFAKAIADLGLYWAVLNQPPGRLRS